MIMGFWGFKKVTASSLSPAIPLPMWLLLIVAPLLVYSHFTQSNELFVSTPLWLAPPALCLLGIAEFIRRDINRLLS